MPFAAVNCHIAGEAMPFPTDELFGFLSCENLVLLGLFSFELSFSILVCRIPKHPLLVISVVNLISHSVV